jgi:GMP synthase (glutamine-hydrolysing)
LNGRHALCVRSARKASDIFCSVIRDVELPAGYELDIDIVQPADGAVDIADHGAYDGVVWTGSSLTIYHDTPEVTRQVELAQSFYAAAVPQYGSCWGLQIAARAAGIPCEANPRGREQGVARGITLTPAGLTHPLFDRTLAQFDGLCAHTDHISTAWALEGAPPPGVIAEVRPRAREWETSGARGHESSGAAVAAHGAQKRAAAARARPGGRSTAAWRFEPRA